MEWFLWGIVQLEPQDMILESAIILKNSCSWYSSLGTENEQETLQNPRCFHSGWASLMAQMVKNPPAMQETWIWSLRWEDPFSLEGMGFLFLFFFCFVLWPHHTAWGILVPYSGIEPAPLAVEAWRSNHWTPKEVQGILFKDGKNPRVSSDEKKLTKKALTLLRREMITWEG